MIDVSQFHATFLEESSEHLANLEQGLLGLESGQETDLNAIFRAAHSIKGGAGTFGFISIAEFTHHAENVLDLARENKLELTSELITELLKATDVISELLDAARAGDMEATAADQERCLAELKKYAHGEQAAPASAQEIPEPQAIIVERLVQVTFKPQPHLPQTGSEPTNIIRELSALGDTTVTCKSDELPILVDLDSTNLYLFWEIEMVTTATDEEIMDVFLFVQDDATIKVETLAVISETVQGGTAKESTGNEPSEVLTATPQNDRRAGADRRQTNDRRKPAAAGAKAPESQFIRVAIDKVDGLLNLIGELVTTQAMVMEHTNKLDGEDHMHLSQSVSEMNRHSRSLQEAIMSIRMMPVDFAFSRFPRMVRDTAQKLNKEVRLVTTGGQTELDKTVIEQISDPLTHLVRNAVDHGIEMPDERVENNKPREGTVELSAYYRGGNVVIEIRDDGKGLDKDKILKKAIEKDVVSEAEAATLSDDQVNELIFAPGFSTADAVSDLSGRGVGMDVVRKNIQSLGGSVHIISVPGQGSCFTIALPLTLAILDGMATRVGSETYIIPILNILESVRPSDEQIKTLQGGVNVMAFREEYLPLLRMSQALDVPHSDMNNTAETWHDGIAVVVETDRGRMALFVDELLGEHQVVIKSIEQNYKAVQGVSGATILGDGRVALIFDLGGLARMAHNQGLFAALQGNTQAQPITQTTTQEGESHS